jgi:type IV secretion system protein VirD4
MTGPPVPTPRSGRLHAGGPNQLEHVWAILVLAVACTAAVVCGIVYTALWADHRLAGTSPTVVFVDIPGLLLAAAGRDTAPLAGAAVVPWRATTIAATLTLLLLTSGWRIVRGWVQWQAGWLHRTRTRQRLTSHVWATARQLAPLLTPTPRRPGSEPPAGGRLWLGTIAGRDVLAPARTSVIAIAPTRTGKSTRLVVPNLLRWDGPTVVTSVKRDVYDLTVDRRRQYGATYLFDPTGATGLATVRWSPLLTCGSFPDATRTAAWLTDAAAVEDRHDTARFWETLATKLLAPMLYAAARTRRTVHHVALWVDRAAFDEVARLLDELGDDDASAAWQAIRSLPDETRGSVLATAMAVFRAFGSPRVRAATSCTLGDTADDVLDLHGLLAGNATLYLVAPEYEQAELRPLFVALVQAVYRTAVELSANRMHGAPLNPPLLLMLDEAGNIAPLKALPKIAATGAGQGIVLMTIWQDRAQIRTLYNHAERTVIANHTSSIWLPGSHDLDTLKLLADLIGDQWVTSTTTATAADGGISVTQGTERIELAPPAFIRTLTHGTAILLTANLPPARITTHAYHQQPRWRRHIPAAQLTRHSAMHTHTGPTTPTTPTNLADRHRPAPSALAPTEPAQPNTPEVPAAKTPAADDPAPVIEADRAAHAAWSQTATPIPPALTTTPRPWNQIRTPDHLHDAVDTPQDGRHGLEDPALRRQLLTIWLETGPADTIADQLPLPQLAAEWPHLPLTHHTRHAWQDAYPQLTHHHQPNTPTL